jgi:ATP-dependent DNA helicase RecG
VVASTCWLVTSASPDGGGNPRIEALVATTNGFELAEVDLDLRGEGTIMSSAQTGRNDLKLASLRRDRELVERAREAAISIVDADPELVQHAELRAELEVFFTEEAEDFLFKN